MFIDFLAMDLDVLVIALVLVAVFFVFFVEKDQQKVAPGFLATGTIAGISGLDIILKWPLPGSYNIVFGEPLVLFGVLLFFTGLALLRGWDLLSLGVFSLLTGIVVVLLGIRMMTLDMTSAPALAGVSYILAGLGAILALPAYAWKQYKWLRYVVAVLVIISAILFALTDYGAYWGHPAGFAKWKPAP